MPLTLRIARSFAAAEGIRAFELVEPEGGELPAFSPGSHIGVRVPNGELRKYSLCNDPAERNHYLIAVKREEHGRGGSISLVDDARDGDVLRCSMPENAFPLVGGANRYLFIAGGIGITPIISMLRSFGDLPPAPWKLVYLTRSPQATAFIDELRDPALAAQVTIHHDGGNPTRAFDLWPLLEKPDTAHIYCCGPRPLMEEVRDMSGHWSAARVHFESFAQGGEVRADDKPFRVRLARSGELFDVPVGETILGVLRRLGREVPASCESGTCGTCRTRLLGGVADHRDMVLLPEQMDTEIMICVSRARSEELTLDL